MFIYYMFESVMIRNSNKIEREREKISIYKLGMFQIVLSFLLESEREELRTFRDIEIVLVCVSCAFF